MITKKTKLNQKPRILHIHVREEYFDQAEEGIKDEEYREIKPYWTKILKKKYDEIYYWRRYSKHYLVFLYDGYTKKTIIHKEWDFKPKKVYAISLRKRVG